MCVPDQHDQLVYLAHDGDRRFFGDGFGYERLAEVQDRFGDLAFGLSCTCFIYRFVLFNA